MNSREGRNRQRHSTNGLPQLQPGHAVSTRPDHEAVRTNAIPSPPLKKGGTRPQQRPPTKIGPQREPTSQDLYTLRGPKGPLTWENVPEVGLEPHSNPLKSATPPENIADAAQSGTYTAQSEAQSVDIVHTPFSGTSRATHNDCRATQNRGRGQSGARSGHSRDMRGGVAPDVYTPSLSAGDARLVR
jgi:hypothetical protein